MRFFNRGSTTTESPERVAEEEIAQRALHKRHLRGWLAYCWASEVFVIISLTVFLPVALEQFGRDNGFYPPDHTEKCVSSTTDTRECVVKIGASWINTASFSLYVNAVAVAIQALLVISLGGIADNPTYRKTLLVIFALVGSLSAVLFLPVPSGSHAWGLVGVFSILAIVGYGSSIVANNAYLPGLCHEAQQVRDAWARVEEEGSEKLDSEGRTVPTTLPIATSFGSEDKVGVELEMIESSGSSPRKRDPDLPFEPVPRTSAPLAPSTARDEYARVLSQRVAYVSSLGVAIGCIGGVLGLLVSLVPVILLKESTFSLRLAISLSGIFWALFTIPAARWLPSRVPAQPHVKLQVGQEVVLAWRRLFDMLRLREIKALRNAYLFLIAWFLLSDGFTTITTTAILFAKTELGMPAFGLVLIGAIAPASGILGALLVPYLQKKTRLGNLAVLGIVCCGVALIPVYGCLGFIPVLRDGHAKFGGLTKPDEMYVLAVIFGGMYGAFQAYARAVFSELIPRGEEARWFALYSITDKASSFLGPIVVGVIADATGNIRWAFFFLLGMVLIAVPFLWAISMRRGKADAISYAHRSSQR